MIDHFGSGKNVTRKCKYTLHVCIGQKITTPTWQNIHTKDKKINVIFANKNGNGSVHSLVCVHTPRTCRLFVLATTTCNRQIPKEIAFFCILTNWVLAQFLCIAKEIRFSTIHLRTLKTRGGSFKVFKFDLVPLNGMFVGLFAATTTKRALCFGNCPLFVA